MKKPFFSFTGNKHGLMFEIALAKLDEELEKKPVTTFKGAIHNLPKVLNHLITKVRDYSRSDRWGWSKYD